MVMVVSGRPLMVLKRQTADGDGDGGDGDRPPRLKKFCAHSPLRSSDRAPLSDRAPTRFTTSHPQHIGGHILQPQRHLRALRDQLVRIGEGRRLLSPHPGPKGALDVPRDGCDLAQSPRRKHEDQRRSHVHAQLFLKTPERLKRNDAAAHVART